MQFIYCRNWSLSIPSLDSSYISHFGFALFSVHSFSLYLNIFLPKLIGHYCWYSQWGCNHIQDPENKMLKQKCILLSNHELRDEGKYALVDSAAAFALCQVSVRNIYTYLSSHRWQNRKMHKWLIMLIFHTHKTILKIKRKCVVYRWILWRKLIKDTYRNDGLGMGVSLRIWHSWRDLETGDRARQCQST